jgi:hypothetical protein
MFEKKSGGAILDKAKLMETFGKVKDEKASKKDGKLVLQKIKNVIKEKVVK